MVFYVIFASLLTNFFIKVIQKNVFNLFLIKSNASSMLLGEYK